MLTSSPKIYLTLLITICLSNNALAKDPNSVSQPVAKNPLPASDPLIEGEVGILGGFAVNAPELGYEESARSTFAVEGELSTPYLGIESELYYTPGMNPSALNSGEPSEYGALCDAKAKLPIYIENSVVSPTLGLGYAIMGESSMDPAVDAPVNLTAPYAVIGLEVAHMKRLFIDIDYAFSLSVSGANPVDLGNGQTDSPRFYRGRVSAAYQVADHLRLGIEFTRHGLYLPGGIPADPEPDTETHLETQGGFYFNF